MTYEVVTDDRTRIILSFAMADHGGVFAHWLRDKLMKKFNFFGANNVYMDCVASRQLTTHHSTTLTPQAQQIAGDTYVSPDTRAVFKPQGYAPIGAMNANWNGMYLKAMSEANTMIMVITPSYLNSEWCVKEWGQFQAERRRRPALRGIGIRFYENLRGLREPNGKPLDQSGIEFLLCNATKGGAGKGLLWDEKMFGLSDPDLERLYTAIGQP